MSTQFATRDGVVVATRFFGGAEVGMVMQMEVTADEFADWTEVMVAAEGSDDFERFAAMVAGHAECGCTVRWDGPWRQNEVARMFETHRFAAEVPGMAAAAFEARQRARFMVRAGMKVVR